MMKQKISFIRLLTITLLCIYLVGCHSVTRITNGSTSEIIFTSTIPYSIKVSPTLPVESVTPALIPTISVIPTGTSPALTLTFTVLPTLTPLPTIPAAEVQAYLENLMLLNSGCQLPCWWGITPGVTEWNEARQFLQSFVTNIYFDEAFPGNYNVEYGIVQEGYFYGAADYFVTNGIVISIVVNSLGTDLGYQLYQILTHYGEPDDVGIFTYPDYLSHGQLPFYIILRYIDKNITALYKFEAEIVNNNVRTCPGYQHIGPWLFLGELNDPAEVLVNPDQPLVSSTGKSVTDFYQIYKNANSTICLKTPTNIWEWP